MRRILNCVFGGALLAVAVGAGVMAQERPALLPTPALNFYGVPGTMDMPSAEMMPDGYLSASSTHFGPISKTTLSFQLAPRISASFRFSAVRDWNELFCPPDCDDINQFDIYYDRSFDLRFLVLEEGTYVPAITVGLQDFVGTGLLSGEYIVATKHLAHGITVSGGLGWGRLGSFGSIGGVGSRPPIDIGQGGNVNTAQWFQGDVAPFAGVQWQINDAWNAKVEYSSDAYTIEAEERETFDRASPLNFGIEYDYGNAVRLGAYYMYGSEFGLAAHFVIDPQTSPRPDMNKVAPIQVGTRPSRAGNSAAFDPSWVNQPDGKAILLNNMSTALAKDGILVEALGFTADTAQVRIRNKKYSNEAIAIGRVARVMSRALPASVEVFEIVPVTEGIRAAKITIRRSDLEALAADPDQAAEMAGRVALSYAGTPIAGTLYDPALFPDFTWAVLPYARFRLFDQTDPLKADFGIRLSARYQVASGLFLSGSVTKKIIGNLDEPPPDIKTGLPPVRSDVDVYDAKGDPAIDTLEAAYFTNLGPDLFGRVSVGLLERMFGGISAEVLWAPVKQRYAIGAEMNYVAQRDPDQLFGFSVYDYQVATGHLSLYYDLGKGYQAQVDVGRYLAGDVGATLALDREFSNGWRIGAFATQTNVSAEDFGSGSFDKGIRLTMPLNWAFGRPTREERTATIRPFGRDGGQRLSVNNRLYDLVSDYHGRSLDAQWSSFWK